MTLGFISKESSYHGSCIKSCAQCIREHLSCIRCRCLTLLCAFQEGERALDTWRSTVESVHSDVGYAPAMAMLSAYGFYNGQTRNDPGGGPAAQTGDLRLSMPCLCPHLYLDIFDEVLCCIIPAMPHVGKISSSSMTGLRPRRSCVAALRF